jgi:uncharacterized protein (TIGR03000 family)
MRKEKTMLRSIFTVWGPVALTALLALAVAPTNVLAAGHGGGGHGGGGGGHGGGGGFHGGSSFHGGGGFHAGGGGFHANTFHGGDFHGGGFHADAFRGGYRNAYGGFYNGYGYGRRDHDFYGFYSPWLYNSPAYISGGYGVLPDDSYSSQSYYYSPDDVAPSGYYSPGAAAPAPAFPNDVATIYVHVPASAELWFDGSPTKQTGDQREFQSPPLERGQNYTYELRARWTDNGRVVDETRKVPVHANGSLSVDFTQPAPAAAASK